jgi:hypothetical protein
VVIWKVEAIDLSDSRLELHTPETAHPGSLETDIGNTAPTKEGCKCSLRRHRREEYY